MSSPFATYPVPERSFIPSTRGTTPARGTGTKRGRKPKGAGPTSTTVSPRTTQGALSPSSQPTTSQWSITQPNATAGPSTAPITAGTSPVPSAGATQDSQDRLSSQEGGAVTLAGSSIPPPPITAGDGTTGRAAVGSQNAEEDGEGEDELLPAMADDDYSAQLSWQSQSKDNLKVLMDNFGSGQYERFEAYRRHALPKQAVRKVIQQTLGQQVSQPVAQIVAGFSKVFVGEMVEKARAVQAQRGDMGPLSPDHLREAYRQYQKETGRVGAARPLKSKRLFTR